jgi:dienelactone hydrolase
VTRRVLDAGPLPPEPIAYTQHFLSILADEAAEESARIPVEQIDCDLLLISGTDDQMWPSTLMADRVERRLRERGFKHSCQHIRCEGAGHAIGVPHLPVDMPPYRHNQTGTVIESGGTAEANAAAAVESWTAIREFLRESLT